MQTTTDNAWISTANVALQDEVKVHDLECFRALPGENKWKILRTGLILWDQVKAHIFTTFLQEETRGVR